MLEILAVLMLALPGDAKVIEPKDDLVITEPVRIKPGVYHIEDKGEPGVLRIEGERVWVVMDGVTIVGAKEGTPPDGYRGTGLVVRGRNCFVRGGAWRGYRVGVKVDGGEGHWLMHVDVGGNYARRLRSTPEREASEDWLRPHENDGGEWAKSYGAGIWIRNAKEVHAIGCLGHGSQNGLILDRSTGCVVRDCDFSFNSGWGIALWRSSDNRIEKNRCNWCVRGYSHGVYARGQDSAGILVFEQSSRNRFTGNSATHSGDGFFLYAGEETLRKTGEGGSNDNVVTGNDFSFAVTNGIEATFSSGNRFEDNRLEGCHYGIWAGYSRDSVFERNLIRGCTYAGVAIEHGSGNEIRGNLIENCPQGIRIWWDEDRDLLGSAYGKKNRTDSADTMISGNVIRGTKAALSVENSARIRFLGNYVAGPQAVEKRGDCPGLDVEIAKTPPALHLSEWKDEPGARPGRKNIVMGEWGPYDFGRPILYPARVEGRDRAVFRVLGTVGPVRVTTFTGEVTISMRMDPEGRPRITVVPAPKAGTYLPFTFTAKVGDEKLTGGGVLLNTRWKVRFWQWTTDPRRDPKVFRALLETPPAGEFTTGAIDFSWGTGSPVPGVGPDAFATLAETKLTLPAGEYELSTVSDDGVRLLVDGKTVLENWTHHTATVDRVVLTIEEGEHRIRIEHFELDGVARLSFRIRKTGSD